jgi:hypothetical protein
MDWIDMAHDRDRWRAIVNVKSGTIPLQALTGPEGSMRLRLSDFKTIGT